MTKKVLGSTEFEQLSEDLQLELLHQDGAYVGKRKVNKKTVVLYQLYGFYVEVYYQHYRKKVARIVTSDSTDILQPYINQIQVRDLKNNDGAGPQPE